MHWLTVRECAADIAVRPSFVRRLIRQGALVARVLRGVSGRREYRITPDDWTAYKASCEETRVAS